MKQWVLSGIGSLDCLKLEEAPIPDFGDHDVLARIHAASLNHRYLKIAMVHLSQLGLPL
jgi:NADPH:quinone reductase-like Zn-dependent oxidoreductase